jgi:hypothetical protein
VPQLHFFKPGYLLSSNIQASLGRTLWIYGEVDASEDYQALAYNCAMKLLAGTNLNLIPNLIPVNDNKLFGSFLLTPMNPKILLKNVTFWYG